MTEDIRAVFCNVYYQQSIAPFVFRSRFIKKPKRKSLYSMLFQVYWSDSGNVKKKKMVF